MQNGFNNAGVGQFGSGWVWLVCERRRLRILATPNQDNPLMDAVEGGGTPMPWQ
jgi:Fe-Mn family superoxide dismutase